METAENRVVTTDQISTMSSPLTGRSSSAYWGTNSWDSNPVWGRETRDQVEKQIRTYEGSPIEIALCPVFSNFSGTLTVGPLHDQCWHVPGQSEHEMLCLARQTNWVQGAQVQAVLVSRRSLHTQLLSYPWIKNGWFLDVFAVLPADTDAFDWLESWAEVSPEVPE